jgi:hypothetical protein
MFVNSLTIGTITMALYIDPLGGRITTYYNGGSKPIIHEDKVFPSMADAKAYREMTAPQLRNSKKQ